MPILCGSLTRGWCPLKKGQNVTYSVPFQIVQKSKRWSLWKDGPKFEKFLFQIDLFGNETGFGIFKMMFRFIVKIKLRGCLLHMFC